MSYAEHVPYFSEQSVPAAARLMQSPQQHSSHPVPASVVSMQPINSHPQHASPHPHPPPTQQQLQAMMQSQHMQHMAMPVLPYPPGGNTAPFMNSHPAPPITQPTPASFAAPAVHHSVQSSPALPTATMPGAPPPALSQTAVSAVALPPPPPAGPSNNKQKKAWSETERSALRDSVIKYRTKKNQHKLPWKLILNDALYVSYRQDRSKDAIMQQWKGLKREVAEIPIPEGESDSDEGTDSESEGSAVSSPQLPALPALPKSSQRSKWTPEDTAALSEAVATYGTDWRLILKDPVFVKRLKYRNAVSLGKNYHRFHPAGVEAKRVAEETRRAKKEAKDEKAALENLSSTSDDESEDEADKPDRRAQLHNTAGTVHASGGGGSGGGKAVKDKRSESDSDSDSSSTSSGGSTDDSSPPVSPAFQSASGVDAPIQAWEKPDERGVAHFRRCRHVCGCKSLTADGREFVNSQAVMVRGSRRNHEVNQNLHPNCRQHSKACERLLGPLKDGKLKGMGEGGAGREEGMDVDGDDDEQLSGGGGGKESGKKKRKRDLLNGGGGGGGAHNGGGRDAEGKEHDSLDVLNNPFILPNPHSPYLAPHSLHSHANPAAQHISALLGQLDAMTQTVRSVQSAGGSYVDAYERLLERAAKQEEEIAELKMEVARLRGHGAVKREEGEESQHAVSGIELNAEPAEQDDKRALHALQQQEESASELQPGASEHPPQLYSPQPAPHHLDALSSPTSLHDSQVDVHVKREAQQHMPMEHDTS